MLCSSSYLELFFLLECTEIATSCAHHPNYTYSSPGKVFLINKLDVFAKDWEEISNFTNYYIDKYIDGNFDDKFTADTAKLLSSLRQRIIKEEISLYSEYNKRI